MDNPTSDNDEPIAQRNSRANLERILGEMIEQPEQRAELAQAVEEIFSQDKAVLVLDMTGFSRTTQRHGIVSFLLMIHQMQLIARPCVDAHGGLLVKAEADNLFCLFDTVADAVRAGQDILERLNAANLLLPEDRRLFVSIGIGFGNILNVADEDLFGNEVNLASKLGEDVAERGEILLTAAARAQLHEADILIREETVSISGLDVMYYKIQS
jgi:class 3 adenylate cyclase